MEKQRVVVEIITCFGCCCCGRRGQREKGNKIVNLFCFGGGGKYFSNSVCFPVGVSKLILTYSVIIMFWTQSKLNLTRFYRKIQHQSKGFRISFCRLKLSSTTNMSADVRPNLKALFVQLKSCFVFWQAKRNCTNTSQLTPPWPPPIFNWTEAAYRGGAARLGSAGEHERGGKTETNARTRGSWFGTRN